MFLEIDGQNVIYLKGFDANKLHQFIQDGGKKVKAKGLAMSTPECLGYNI